MPPYGEHSRKDMQGDAKQWKWFVIFDASHSIFIVQFQSLSGFGIFSICVNSSNSLSLALFLHFLKLWSFTIDSDTYLSFWHFRYPSSFHAPLLLISLLSMKGFHPALVLFFHYLDFCFVLTSSIPLSFPLVSFGEELSLRIDFPLSFTPLSRPLSVRH